MESAYRRTESVTISDPRSQEITRHASPAAFSNTVTTKLESYGRTDRTGPGDGFRRLPNLAAEDAGSHLMNFPFAMALFVLLGGSALLVCVGAFCASPWTAAVGVTLMLLTLGIHGAASVEN